METYKPIVKNFVHWCADNYPIQNLRDIKHSMFRDYVQKEFSHLKANTVKTRLAAISKFGEGIGKSESFHRLSKQVQQTLPVDKVSRPTYKDLAQALQVCEKVAESNPRYGLAFTFQLETACRVCEMERLRLDDLQGIVKEDGQTIGLVRLEGKGGYKQLRDLGLSSHEARENMLHEANRVLGHSPERTSTTKVYLRG